MKHAQRRVYKHYSAQMNGTSTQSRARNLDNVEKKTREKAGNEGSSDKEWGVKNIFKQKCNLLFISHIEYCTNIKKREHMQ